MAVAFDAFTKGSGSLDPTTWTHTPVGTPKGVIVLIGSLNNSDIIVGVTYGGVAMTEVPGSPNVLSGGETGSTYCYFLGSGIPTGAQTVSVDTTGAGGFVLGYSITLTASADTEVVDSDGTINSTASANPSVTLSLGGRTCFAAIAFLSGHDAVGSITQLSGWTNRDESDTGTRQIACYTYDTIGTTDVTAGWTQTSEDAVAMAIAVAEVAAVNATLSAALATATGAQSPSSTITGGAQISAALATATGAQSPSSSWTAGALMSGAVGTATATSPDSGFTAGMPFAAAVALASALAFDSVWTGGAVIASAACTATAGSPDADVTGGALWVGAPPATASALIADSTFTGGAAIAAAACTATAVSHDSTWTAGAVFSAALAAVSAATSPSSSWVGHAFLALAVAQATGSAPSAQMLLGFDPRRIIIRATRSELVSHHPHAYSHWR